MLIDDITPESKRTLAVMAHDVKAPLSSIISLLNVIIKGYVTDMDKIKELVARANHKAETLVSMLDDIMDYTLLANRLEMKRDCIDISAVLEDSINLLLPYANEKNVCLNHCHDCQPETFINGNYTFILRVFNNLIMNAIKYNKENGEVNFGYCKDITDGTITITISDTGIGIPEDEIDKVFHIFERGTYARRNVDGSIGLGLSLVKKIVEEHKGKIALSSTLGVGTTITVTLPLIKEGGTTNEV